MDNTDWRPRLILVGYDKDVRDTHCRRNAAATLMRLAQGTGSNLPGQTLEEVMGSQDMGWSGESFINISMCKYRQGKSGQRLKGGAGASG